MKIAARGLVVFGLICLMTTAAAYPGEIRVLIVDGQNNHNWKATTPVMKSILEDAGIFKVDVATSPPRGKDMSGFKPDFAKYGVVLSNYNGAPWPEETKKAFVKFIRDGGGFVCVHATDNSFPNWKEYNEIIGVGGWGGRNEKSGPKLRWESGKIIRDTSMGRAGSHGSRHEYPIDIRVKDHPITAGLPDRWMHAKDELYDSLRGPAKNLTVLATAYSDPRQHGTGHHEPILMAIKYGKGRSFHTVLGHDAACMRCVGFAVTLQRGTEWAATGKVTIPVPPNFPTADKVRLISPSNTAKVKKALKASVNYKLGENADNLKFITNAVHASINKPRERKEIEAELIKHLESRAASKDFKRFICRRLWAIGSEQSVPALAKLLTNADFSHMVRPALENIDSPAAAKVLRDALKMAQGEILAGIINSLGRKRDHKAVPAIAQLMKSPNTTIAQSAASALGNIGGEEAAAALAAARKRSGASSKLRAVIDDASLLCADGFVNNGQNAKAHAIYEKLYAPGEREHVRSAALRGMVSIGGDKALTIVMKPLTGSDPAMQAIAVSHVIDVPGEAATKAFAAQLPKVSTSCRALLLGALARRGDKAALPQVVASLKDRSPKVRISAAQAIGKLGNASAVVPLANAAACAKGFEAKTTLDSLARLNGPDVDDTIIRALKSSPAKTKVVLIKSLSARRAGSAVPALLKCAENANKSVRIQAFKALGALADEKALPDLVRLLCKARGASERSAAEKAVSTVAAGIDDPGQRSLHILVFMPMTRGPAKASLLKVLGKCGGASALDAVKAALKDNDAEVQDAAIRSLAGWPDPGAADTLLEIVASKRSKTHRVLALRGLVHSLGLPSSLSVKDRLEKFDKAIKLAASTSDKKMVIGGIANIAHPDALKLLEQYRNNQSLKAEAEAAIKKIKDALSGSPVATASHNGGKVGQAIDGNPDTRWDTAGPMRKGMWFMLDQKVEKQVGRIVLECKKSAGDYPRGYELYLSNDNKNWGKPVATGKGTSPVVTISFKPQHARFIKIVQTGESDRMYWSIHTLQIEPK